MRIKRYHLAAAPDPQTLQTEINKLLGEGWQPLGEVVVAPPSDQTPGRFLQTMVQFEGEIRS